VRPLSESRAVDLGAEVIGEMTIFSVAASVLLLEYGRQKEKEEKAKREALEHDQHFVRWWPIAVRVSVALT
jgi:optic atrophy 3 protein